ncbi:MAG: hypothetical protein AAF628_36790 [Planctomycetota bacterium]
MARIRGGQPVPVRTHVPFESNEPPSVACFDDGSFALGYIDCDTANICLFDIDDSLIDRVSWSVPGLCRFTLAARGASWDDQNASLAAVWDPGSGVLGPQYREIALESPLRLEAVRQLGTSCCATEPAVIAGRPGQRPAVLRHDGRLAVLMRTSSELFCTVRELTGAECQPNLGFQGPGSAAATLCGTGLRAGENSDYMVVDAPASASGALLISVFGAPNVPFAGGTLASFAQPPGVLPIAADPRGQVTLTFDGLSTVANLVFQSVFIDLSLPQSFAFTNAIKAQFGR